MFNTIIVDKLPLFDSSTAIEPVTRALTRTMTRACLIKYLPSTEIIELRSKFSQILWVLFDRRGWDNRFGNANTGRDGYMQRWREW